MPRRYSITTPSRSPTGARRPAPVQAQQRATDRLVRHGLASAGRTRWPLTSHALTRAGFASSSSGMIGGVAIGEQRAGSTGTPAAASAASARRSWRDAGLAAVARDRDVRPVAEDLGDEARQHLARARSRRRPARPRRTSRATPARTAPARRPARRAARGSRRARPGTARRSMFANTGHARRADVELGERSASVVRAPATIGLWNAHATGMRFAGSPAAASGCERRRQPRRVPPEITDCVGRVVVRDHDAGAREERRDLLARSPTTAAIVPGSPPAALPRGSPRRAPR